MYDGRSVRKYGARRANDLTRRVPVGREEFAASGIRSASRSDVLSLSFSLRRILPLFLFSALFTLLCIPASARACVHLYIHVYPFVSPEPISLYGFKSDELSRAAGMRVWLENTSERKRDTALVCAAFFRFFFSEMPFAGRYRVMTMTLSYYACTDV